MKFFKYISNIIRFMSLPKDQRRLVFYSEGKNYWPHLKDVLYEALENLDISVCYVSSNDNDPGLSYKHKNLHTFLIDEGSVRNWFFANIETDIMVMTMPDIEQYQVKRSRYPVHYFYVQHSLYSLHTVYRKGAFDYYDTVCCAGDYHVKELRAIEKLHKLKEKNIVPYGYARLYSIMDEAQKRREKDTAEDKKSTIHILIAPSWGKSATIESGVGAEIVDVLLEKNIKVTLRPHPETIKLALDTLTPILKKHNKNPLFSYEASVDGQKSLHESDLMISDWSGAALDYAVGLNKPVVFIDVPRKINNPDSHKIDIEPLEVMIREKIGLVLDPENIRSDLANIDFAQLSAPIVPKDLFYKADPKDALSALKEILKL